MGSLSQGKSMVLFRKSAGLRGLQERSGKRSSPRATRFVRVGAEMRQPWPTIVHISPPHPAQHGQASSVTAAFDIPTLQRHLKVRSSLIEPMYHLPWCTARPFDFKFCTPADAHAGRLPTHTRNHQARTHAQSIKEEWNITVTESSIFFVFFPFYFSFVNRITTIKQRASGNYG